MGGGVMLNISSATIAPSGTISSRSRSRMADGAGAGQEQLENNLAASAGAAALRDGENLAGNAFAVQRVMDVDDYSRRWIDAAPKRQARGRVEDLAGGGTETRMECRRLKDENGELRVVIRGRWRCVAMRRATLVGRRMMKESRRRETCGVVPGTSRFVAPGDVDLFYGQVPERRHPSIANVGKCNCNIDCCCSSSCCLSFTA